MARKKRLKTVQSSEDYLTQAQAQAHVELTMDSEMPSDGVEVTIQDNVGVKHSRGKTLLPHLWEMDAGHRIVVGENSLFQPIGAEAGLLGQYLGTLARNGSVCSLSYSNWKLLKKVKLTEILRLIKLKFIYNSKCEKWILASLNAKWSQYKSTLKSLYFDESKPLEEMCSKVPPEVIPDQWIYLVCYWSSPEAKAVSARNKRARAMLKTTHTSGTKSFARKAHEIKMNDPEKKDPSRTVVFLATHKPDDEVASAIQKQMELSEMTSDLEGRIAWEGDAVSQVLGKDKGAHVRGVGLVSDPKSVLQPTRRYQDMDITTLDEKRLIVLVRELLKKVDKQGVELQELKSRVHTMECGTSYNQTSSGSPNEGISPSNTSAYNNQSGLMNLLNTGDYGDFPEY